MRAVVYLLDNSRKHARMARKSMGMLRRHSPEIKVACLTTHQTLSFDDSLNVEMIPIRNLDPDYFITNKAHLASLDYDEILFLDSDTFPLADVNRIFDLYDCDFAGCQTNYAAKLGWTAYPTYNSGALLFRNGSNKRIYEDMERHVREFESLHPELYEFLTQKYSLWTREEMLISKLAHEKGISSRLIDRSHIRIMDEPSDIRFAKDCLIFHSYTNYWGEALAQIEPPKVKVFPYKRQPEPRGEK